MKSQKLIRQEAKYTQNIDTYLVHKSFNSELFSQINIDKNNFELATLLTYINDTLDSTRQSIYVMYHSYFLLLPHIQLDSTIPIKWDSGVILHRPQNIPVINHSQTSNTQRSIHANT